MSFWDDVFGKKSRTDTASNSRTETARPEFVAAPEYDETGQARGAWFDKVMSFGDMPGYGAISPDWSDIWERARTKVEQYYMGTPTRGGALDRVKSSAARRGVSESPALEAQIGALGAQEGGDLTQLAREQAIAEASFAEQGRNSWLDQIRMLSSLGGPAGRWWEPWTTTTNRQESTNIATDSPWDNIMKVGSVGLGLFGGGGGGMPSGAVSSAGMNTQGVSSGFWDGLKGIRM